MPGSRNCIVATSLVDSFETSSLRPCTFLKQRKLVSTPCMPELSIVIYLFTPVVGDSHFEIQKSFCNFLFLTNLGIRRHLPTNLRTCRVGT